MGGWSRAARLHWILTWVLRILPSHAHLGRANLHSGLIIVAGEYRIDPVLQESVDLFRSAPCETTRIHQFLEFRSREAEARVSGDPFQQVGCNPILFRPPGGFERVPAHPFVQLSKGVPSKPTQAQEDNDTL